MVIYRLELILLEKVFFASREIDELFQTEPVLGNYGLTYALGLAVSPYRLSEREDRPYTAKICQRSMDKGSTLLPQRPWTVHPWKSNALMAWWTLIGTRWQITR